jgi:hypothetical protein
MNLYLVYQRVDKDYDTYDSFVVCACSEHIARVTHPATGRQLCIDYDGYFLLDGEGTAFTPLYNWVDHIGDVNVTLLGEADASISAGIVCRSFNAG